MSGNKSLRRELDAASTIIFPSAYLAKLDELKKRDGGKPAIEPNKQKTIGIVEVRSFRRPSAKHIDLLP